MYVFGPREGGGPVERHAVRGGGRVHLLLTGGSDYLLKIPANLVVRVEGQDLVIILAFVRWHTG